ncbi:hypothetical protein [Natrinema versiforme]|uniref:Uncharacterized protein n=2 Tax=root TaxID=1 RepID=A0A4V1G0F0_9EURY|nr:hypothetical protein [Natrinema versiforme]YP_010772694.1 hypothetical protein QIT49_gp27 [Natrinema versiforme icosahedral virus 1]QCS45116.1 hypothetical protein FEJ81_22870 [Natrinema versiforme]DAC85277.1 TPA_asm: hypothetical protein NVIV1gp12 [Natrinema versiforme icosahedral virus 1]
MEDFSGFLIDGMGDAYLTPTPVPDSALDGEGTAIINTIQGIVTNDSVDQSEMTASKDTDGYQFVPSKSTYGQPIRWTESVVRDPTGEWPVEVITTLELEVEDPASLDLDAIMAGGYGECLVGTEIDGVEVDQETGLVTITLATTYECEPESEETTGEQWVQLPDGVSFSNPSTTSETSNDDDSSTSPSSPWLSSGGDNPLNQHDSVDHYYIDWYQRRLACGNACLPAGDSTTLPLTARIEGPDIQEIEIRMLFDESTVSVDAVNSTAPFSLSGLEIDNNEGYIDFSATPDETGSYSFDPISGRYDDEWTPRFATIDITTVGETGDSATLAIYPPDTNVVTADGSILEWDGVGEDGRRFGEIAYVDGHVSLENGMALGNATTTWGDTTRVPFSVDAATDIAGYSARLQIQRDEPIDDLRVEGVDLPDPDWSYETEEVIVGEIESGPDEGEPIIERRGYLDLEVPADVTNQTHDPTLCEIVLDAPLPETPEEIPATASTAIKYNLDRTDLYDAAGDVVTAPCNRPGSFTIRQNAEIGPKIPEVGVAYWPILFPMVFRYPGIEMDAVDRSDISIETSSPTNPDISHKINEVVFGTPSEPNTLFVQATILIPKADPQAYPVEYSALLWIGRTLAAATGGLWAGQGVAMGGHVEQAIGSSGMSVGRGRSLRPLRNR